MVNGTDTRRGWIGGLGARLAVGLVWLVAGWLMWCGTAVASRPGRAQVPQAPRVVFFEDFEHNMALTPVVLTDYTPAPPYGDFLKYTADPQWLTDCNGTVMAFDSPNGDWPLSTCQHPGGNPPWTTQPFFWGSVRQIAWAIGAFEAGCTPKTPAQTPGADCPAGAPDPNTLHSVSAFTQDYPPGLNTVVFRTVGLDGNLAPIPLEAHGRFITFSVEVGEQGCDNLETADGRPILKSSLKFYLSNAAGDETALFNSPIEVCFNPGGEVFQSPAVPGLSTTFARPSTVGDFAANDALLFTGDRLGVVLRNGTDSNNSNDFAFNNIRVLDATPQLDKQFVPDVINPGQTSDVVFTVTNTSDFAAKHGWSFADTLPAGVVVASPETTSTTCGAGTTVSAPAGGDRISVTNGDLPASTAAVDGGDPYCQVVVRVTAARDGTYVNRSGDVSLVGLNPPADATLRVGSADLSIQKTTRPRMAVAGELVRFHLRVVNHGPLAAHDVVVSDPLPAGLTFVRGSAGCALSGGTVQCSLASLAAGASTAFRVVARVSPKSHDGFVNTATVSAPTPDPDLSNNSSTVAVPVARRADVAITKTALVSKVTAGGQVQYVLVVRNHGPSRATQVTVTDPLARQLTATSAVPSQGSCSIAFGVVCQLGSLAVGGSAQVLVAANVDQTATGPVSNTARVVSAETDPNPANNAARATVEVHPLRGPQQDVADPTVTKHVNRRRAHPGQRLIYTLTVTNRGPQAATGVILRDTSNLGLRLISVNPSQGHCARSLPLDCRLGTIPIHRQVKITIIARATRPGTFTDVASVTADQRDPNPHTSFARATVHVLRAAPPPPQVTG